MEILFDNSYNSLKGLKRQTYKSFGLRVIIDYERKSILLDISSKLLGGGYIYKINCNNITKIFCEVKKIIKIPEEIFYSSFPHYCEVVIDYDCESIHDLLETLFSFSKLQTKYKPSPKLYKSNKKATSFYLKKNVLTRQYSDYLSIYNKENELRKSCNSEFLKTLENDDLVRIFQYFSGKVRFEGKFNSIRAIRTKFDMQKDDNLNNLLQSKVNVVHNLLNAIYDDKLLNITDDFSITHKDIDRFNTLKMYDFDLQKILEVHKLLGNTRQNSKIIKPYKELLYKKTRLDRNEKIIEVKKLIKDIEWKTLN